MSDRRTRYPGPIAQAGVIAHDLIAQGFAEDAALAALLDRYPAELFDINLYDYDDEGQVSLRTGARGRLDGAQLLEAIQQGRLWVNLRDVETGWPELWAAAMAEFKKVEAAYPGLKAVKNAGQLILSSPKARVPYHFDAAGVVLFHLRGRKRIFVYPGDEGHLPERNMEQVVARQTTEELPYTLAFEDDAHVVDLEPGQALTWPLYAPHRVENLDRFCVSLSMDFQTWPSRFRNGALYTNAVMRSRGGSPRFTDQMGQGALAARWAASLALRRMGALKSKIAHFEREFEPEVGAADGAGALKA
ncbi:MULTISPECIES: cupin-like domain-containing protein [unclassified Brevundimonas]|uniref:cupin-like domain-containing protein n=1 Tax=unclassified Brevundimonas TaxID=2622653 RepID=UPI000CFBC144|nr:MULTISPECIES: cupin-like domain-containing protein [unclassified Brevundimonas]PRA26170.1 transcriptional regulator [Brevundimonas sp. MYb27]PQZ81736.1 transcriptional regulator [Brevundimonas sp. MYb31]PRB18060.1 transcriptional regulator [Brevundimonas sp. MYb52]PRB38304.1 transcriptional regulator [Brevundimonas sp. MYb46]PRB45782.1 transcriptional regulator [Brevundimonas sp. MYb33]